MIYFDNAATTKYKPDSVYDAVNYYLREMGVSPGRGSYSLGIEASRKLYQARKTVGHFFGLSKPDAVIFTKNSTEAINLFFEGLLNKGDHVIISCYEHNAVLRPIHYLKEQGIIDYSVINKDDLLLSPAELYEKYARRETKVIAVTLASNLTGRIIWNRDLTKYFQKKGIVTFVDSSQGAGKLDINMSEDGIDFLAFTGHKDLLAIPGVGGLCCQSKLKIKPLIQGGTGIHGEEYVNPEVFPEGFEAGTLNMPAIWSLKSAIEFIQENKAELRRKECDMMEYLINILDSIDEVVVYDRDSKRVPTCSINVEGIRSDKLVSILDEHGICTRGGIHCAILAHEALGTTEFGTVRISLSYTNTKEEIDTLCEILKRGE